MPLRIKRSPCGAGLKWSCFHAHGTTCHVDTHVLSNRVWGILVSSKGGRGTMFASQYVQQLRIQRSLKVPPRPCHLFVGHLKTVNWLLKRTVVVFQICRFCWHRIRTDENGLCPACRKVSTIFVPYFTQKSYQWRAFKNHFLFKNIFKNHSHGASSRNWRRNKYSAVVVVSWKNICVAISVKLTDSS